MVAVFFAQCRQLFRNPQGVLLMCALTLVFTFALGMNSEGKDLLYVFADESLEDNTIQKWLDALNDSEVYEFELVEEPKARQAVAEGRADLAVQLFPQNYQIVVLVENPNVGVAERHIQHIFREELRFEAAVQQLGDVEQFQNEFLERLADPVLLVESHTVTSEGTLKADQMPFIYNRQLQALFGFTFFFSIYTIGMCVNRIMLEKRSGVWDRIILSPARKADMYIGHLCYSFMIGFGQMLFIFLMFKYAFHYDLGQNFGAMLVVLALYTFAIVALCILFTGLVKTAEQFNTLLPLVSVSMAMLGGAYWPIEIVTNPILLKLAKIVPVYHAMDAVKKISFFDYNLSLLAEPLLLLVLFGVICLGIGINLMERRHV